MNMEKEQQPDLFKVLAFTGDHITSAQGNVCNIYAYSTRPSSSSTVLDTKVTRCQTWFDNQKNVYVVECFNDGRLIACCGHGLLSTAYYWMHKQKLDKLFLLMNGTLIPTYFDNNNVWLRFPRIACTPCDRPTWLNKLIGNDQSIAAATAGDDDGYLIVQWPDNYPLDCLSKPGKSLAKFSQRAVIYTARYKSIEPSEILMQFRYFAPQYGVEEDDATGSAMRILIDYWAELADQNTTITALQASPAKGLLRARLSKMTVDIGGCVSRLE
jgi:predicted PhzF superfamily epimerase YddE/YHI9